MPDLSGDLTVARTILTLLVALAVIGGGLGGTASAAVTSRVRRRTAEASHRAF